jgi:hypothetical protein
MSVSQPMLGAKALAVGTEIFKPGPKLICFWALQKLSVVRQIVRLSIVFFMVKVWLVQSKYFLTHAANKLIGNSMLLKISTYTYLLDR